MATGDTAPLAIGQELAVARDVVLGQVQNVPMSEDSTHLRRHRRRRRRLHLHLRQEGSEATSPATKMEVTRKSTAWSTQAQGA